jgi:hypothetical protein
MMRQELSAVKVAEISHLLLSTERTLLSSPPVFQRCRSAPSCRVDAMRAYEEHMMSQRIARHKPDVVDELPLPAPTKFKKEKNSDSAVWKIGRSYSAPSSNISSERPPVKIEVTENIFIQAVILVRIYD